MEQFQWNHRESTKTPLLICLMAFYWDEPSKPQSDEGRLDHCMDAALPRVGGMLVVLSPLPTEKRGLLGKRGVDVDWFLFQFPATSSGASFI